MTDTSKKASGLGPLITLPQIPSSTGYYLDTLSKLIRIINHKNFQQSDAAVRLLRQWLRPNRSLTPGHLATTIAVLSKDFSVIKESLTTIATTIISKTHAQ